MNCHSELDYLRYIDDEIQQGERHRLDTHLASCAPCRRLVEELRAEAGQIRLAIAEPYADERLARLAQNVSVTVLLALGLRYALVGPREWTWIAAVPAALGALADAPALMFLLLVVVALLSFRAASDVLRRRVARPILPLILFSLLVPGVAHGMTRRTGDVALVGRDEVIHDSVFAGGEVVRIDGTIDGDLYAMGRRVEISGRVRGRIMATGEVVWIDGEVGRVHAVGREVTVRGHVSGSVHGWGERVTIAPEARVDGACTMGGRWLTVAGEMRGRVNAFGNDFAVPASARLRGGLRADLARRDAARIDPAAIIEGSQKIRGDDRLGLAYLASTFVWLILAFACGWGLWRYRPHLAACSASALESWWRSVAWGMGSLTLLALACVAPALTMIGLPFAVAGAVVAATIWFVSQVVVAGHVADALGQRWAASFPVRLFVSLAGIALLSWPAYGVGTAFSISLSVAGSGALVRTMWSRSMGTLEQA